MHEERRRARLKHDLAVQRQKANRVALALQGVSALCELGLTKQFQRLIKIRGTSIGIHGGAETRSPGYDMSDVHWKYVGFIRMTATHLQVHNYVETSGDFGATFRKDSPAVELNFPYAVDDAFLRTRLLWRIATPHAIDWDEVATLCEKNRSAIDSFPTEVMFEILVECAEPEILSDTFRKAIR